MDTPSPAIDRATAQINAMFDASEARKAHLDADPRIIWLRAQHKALNAPLGHGMVGAAQIFSDMANGRAARRARISVLIRARMQMLDGFPHIARKHLQDAAANRRQWAAPVVVEAVNLRTAMHEAA